MKNTNMNVKIDNKTIELQYSFRSLMIYEKITGDTFNPKGITEVLIYFYSTIMGSDKDLNLSFDDFIQMIDNDPQLLPEFSQWLNKTIQKNSFIMQNEKNNEEKKSQEQTE